METLRRWGRGGGEADRIREVDEFSCCCGFVEAEGCFRDASRPDPDVRCRRIFLASASSSESALEAFRLLETSLSASLDLSRSLSLSLATGLGDLVRPVSESESE